MHRANEIHRIKHNESSRCTIHVQWTMDSKVSVSEVVKQTSSYPAATRCISSNVRSLDERVFRAFSIRETLHIARTIWQTIAVRSVVVLRRQF